MDKKVGVSILYGLILLVGLIGVTKFAISYGDGTFLSESTSVTDVLGQANISLDGDGYSNESYTKGGASEIVNLTIFFGLGNSSGDDTTNRGNITNFTIEWDAAANFTFLGFVSNASDVEENFEGACTDEALDLGAKCDTFNSSTEFSNVTFVLDGPGGGGLSVGDWTCRNLTATIINCNNATDNDGLGPDNTTLLIRFNVTAAADVENYVDWNITTYINVSADNSIGNSTNLTTFIDGLPPKITDINITDGNITLYNATSLGNANDFNISDEYTLSPNATLTILASVHDLNLDGIQGTGTLRLFYNNTATGVGDNGGSGNLTALGNSGNGSTALDANASFVDGVIVNTWTSSEKLVDRITSNALVSWTIPQPPEDDIYNITKFQFLLNDSYDFGIVVQEGHTDGIDAPFTVSRNSSIIPTIQSFNITQDDGTTVSNGNLINSSYLAAGNWTVTVDISERGVTNVSVFFNETGNFGNIRSPSDGAPFINGVIPSASDEFTEATTDYAVRNTSGYAFNAGDTVGWSTNLEINSVNDSNLITFVVVVNGSLMGGLESDEAIIGFNTSAANFSVVAGPYYITVDASAPSPELNTPTTRGISTGDSIEYKCTANEPASGVQKYTWYLKKPGSDNTYTKISEESKSDSTDTEKFSGTSINVPGTYTVRCEVTDNVGNLNYKDTTGSNDFTVTISSTGGGAGGVGGGGAAAAVSFDVDFTTLPQATFKASQGRVKSFSFDGVTKHTITFNEVTADGVTLIIASNPITVKLNTGQSKSVDVNADGADDMKVQLNSVDNGVADVTVTKVEAGAAKVRAEEEQARGAEAGEEGREVTPVAGRSLAWLWWTLIVIVAIVVIGYYVNKRK